MVRWINCLKTKSAGLSSEPIRAYVVIWYLDKFDFRYSNRAAFGVDDTTCAVKAIKGAAGKRLTYRQSRSA